MVETSLARALSATLGSSSSKSLFYIIALQHWCPTVEYALLDDVRATSEGRLSRLNLPTPPPPTRLVGNRDVAKLMDCSANESLSEDEPEPHPFAKVPGLKDCPLAGLRAALSRQPSADTPTDRQTALWTQSRGGTEVRSRSSKSVVNHCFTSLFGTNGLLSDIVIR